MILTPITNPIDAKADKVHTHTTAQVTGLDAALTNANWHKGAVPAGATLDDLAHGIYHIQGGSIAENLGLPARVGSLEIRPGYYGTKTATAVVNLVNGTAHEVWTNTQNANAGVWVGWRKSVLVDPASSTTNLDLRLDTTVGTRIFAGNTMIFGDTGWREVSADLLHSNFGLWSGTSDPPAEANPNAFVRLKRDGNTVTLDARVMPLGDLVGTNRRDIVLLSDNIPIHFRPHRDHILVGEYWSYTSGERGLIRGRAAAIELRGADGIWVSNELVIVHASWETSNNWPNTLPGLPV